MKYAWIPSLALVLPLAVQAQEELGLKDAARLALERNKSVEATGVALKAAAERVTEAKSGQLPKVNYSESWTRSDNPVFVFSSLLTQHQFGPGNFQIDTLNRPGFLNNFQSAITADQTLYDGGQTKTGMRAAELSKDFSGEEERRARMETIASVVRAYYGVLLSEERLSVSEQSMRSATADLERAQAVRTAGMSTDMDVLSIRVHLAGVREEQIRRGADLDVARAGLNDAIGLPLDTPHRLTTSLAMLEISSTSLAALESAAMSDRPESREAKLAIRLAETRAASARGALGPTVTLHGAFEADRQRFVTRGGDNWLVSIGLRWNLFNGFGDRARVSQAKYAVEQSSAEAARAESAIRLQVRRCYADLRAATQRIDVAQASVAQAEESLRITQDRYAAGMSTVTDLIRTEVAVLEARTRRWNAIHDQRVAAANLELAAGTLSVDSTILNGGAR
jgi:outer membrane protein